VNTMQLPARRTLAAAVAAALTALCAPAAMAFGFAESWRAAQQADPQYRSARHELEATRYAIPIAKSQLRPQVGIATSDTKVNGSRDFTNSNGQPASTSLDYTSRSRSLSVRMPVVNMDAWARLRLSEAQVAYAEAVYQVRGKDLATRLGKAYFDLLYALEGVGLAERAVATYTEAVAFAQRRLRGGEGTRTDVGEAEARLDIAKAALIEARDYVEVARRTLQVISGQDTASVRAPEGVPTLLPVEPASLQAWLERTEANSPDVVARRLQVDAARAEVKRARTGHYPKVDAVASLSRSENDTINTLNTRINQSTIGVQLNVPIYNGGYVDATTEQALTLVRKAEEDLEAELNTQKIEVRRQFLAASTGLARIEAFEKAVRSSEIALEGTQFGVRAGLRTNLDVLDATRQLFQARRDLVQARYTYLQSVLQLKVAAGEPLDQVIEEIDRMLRTPDTGRVRVASQADGPFRAGRQP